MAYRRANGNLKESSGTTLVHTFATRDDVYPLWVEIPF